MRVNRYSRLTVPFAISLLAAACGGGGVDLTGDAELGAANAETTVSTGNNETTTEIESPAGLETTASTLSAENTTNTTGVESTAGASVVGSTAGSEVSENTSVTSGTANTTNESGSDNSTSAANTGSTGVLAPEIGEANAIDAGVAISGRVADGYIRGATVCVDINENNACDTDEPFAITVEGGAYDISIPLAHRDKPIVAAIPADAIDEDTEEAVGEALVFIAPADHPEFVSPITTLVHQEQRDNPTLNSDEAEQSVKTLLGIDEEGVSLFDDYVEQSDESENTDGTTKRFKYLHDTARVVASMMKDVENQVESAAISSGIDVSGQSETKRAIQDIVRKEVREALSQIGREVSEIVSANESISESDSVTQLRELNPQALALALRPEITEEEVTGRIEANFNRIESVESDLRSLLRDGVYSMEFDCSHVDGALTASTSEVSSNDTNLTIDIADFPARGISECAAIYSKILLSADEAKLESEQYVLNKESGTWEPTEDRDNNAGTHYSLVNGQWTVVASDGLEGQIEFVDTDTAVLTNDEGTTRLKSVTQNLDGSAIIHHFLEDNAGRVWLNFVSRNDLFPAESKVHRIGVRQSSNPYVMFNLPEHGSVESNCVNFNGNCNVVEILNDGESSTAVSLSQLRESAKVGVNLRTLSGLGAVMQLQGLERADGTLPKEGRVKWIVGSSHPGDVILPGETLEEFDNDSEQIDPEEVDDQTSVEVSEVASLEALQNLVNSGVLLSEAQIDAEVLGFTSQAECVATLNNVGTQGSDSNVELPESLFSPGEFAGTREELAALLAEADQNGETQTVSVSGFVSSDVDEFCASINSETSLSESELSTVDEDDTIVAAALDVLDQVVGSFDSRWKLIEVDGVEMIEVHLPLMFRDNSASEAGEALLLIEQDGFIRAGVRLPGTKIDRILTYRQRPNSIGFILACLFEFLMP